MNYLLTILQFLVFPGLVFTAVVGLVTIWIDRKVTARVQMRVGPPFLQPFYDTAKLMIKETCIPEGCARGLFLSAPLFGFASVILASTIIWRSMISPKDAFVGDLIVLLYLLTVPAMSVVAGAFASRNPLASLGGSREMKLILAYELPFVIAILVPVMQSQTIVVGELVSAPASATSLSGLLALLVAIVCAQAKLTLIPFDIPEAETELTGGAYVEYSGPPLAIFKLTKAMMMFTLPMFLVAVFMGGIDLDRGVLPVVLGVLKYVILVVIAVLIRNTAPRIREDQVVRFFWGPLTGVALLASVLAAVGW